MCKYPNLTVFTLKGFLGCSTLIMPVRFECLSCLTIRLIEGSSQNDSTLVPPL